MVTNRTRQVKNIVGKYCMGKGKVVNAHVLMRSYLSEETYWVFLVYLSQRVGDLFLSSIGVGVKR